MSMDKWMDKQNVVYVYNGILFHLEKKKEIVTCYSMDEPWEHYMSKINQSQKDRYGIIPCICGI